MRFVIADDMHTPRTVVHRILLEAGHEVVGAAGGGQEAIALTLKHQPDAVIFDISMPGMMGDVAAHKVRAAMPNLIIFISSNISNEHTRTTLEKISAHFIVKPYRKEQLMNVINDVIGAPREAST